MAKIRAMTEQEEKSFYVLEMTEQEKKDLSHLAELSDECLKGNFGMLPKKIKEMRKIANYIEKQTCMRCGYEFFPFPERDLNDTKRVIKMKLPKTCPNPKCKSPYWNKPRTKGI